MNIYVTRKIPQSGIDILRDAGHDVDVSDKDGVLTKQELIEALQEKEYDAVLCLLTDDIDAEVFDAAPNAKIFSNYAVGYNNIDTEAAKERGVTITNTPGILTDSVAEHTFALLMTIARRAVEADRFTRAGKYDGWAPELFLGAGLRGKTLGILGAGRIGLRVAEIAARGYEMRVVYYDIQRNAELEESVGAEFRATSEEVLAEADFVTVHVPLLESTKHLINKTRLNAMKSTAYLINTSRGPVVDEHALVDALTAHKIRGAALDVFEDEPKLADGLTALDNVIVTPHIASATQETRNKMSEMAAQAIIDALSGKRPEHIVE